MANFANALFAGMDQGANRQALQSQNALRGAQAQAVTQESQLKQRKAVLDEIAKAAAWADTPEKWNQAIDVLRSAVPEVEQYRNAFPQRDMLIQRVLTESQQYDQMLGQRMTGAIGPEAGAPPAPVQGQPANALMQPAPAVTALPLDAPDARGRAMTLADARVDVESGGKQFDSSGNALRPPLSEVKDRTGGIPVGASQIKPDTARTTARNHGIPFDEKRLETDPEYNRMLGDLHQNDLMARFGDNPTLIAAAYHSGAGSVDKWIERFGEPGRDVSADEWTRKVERAGNPRTAQYIRRINERIAGPRGEVRNAGDTGRFPREDAAPASAAQPADPGLTRRQRMAVASGSAEQMMKAFEEGGARTGEIKMAEDGSYMVIDKTTGQATPVMGPNGPVRGSDKDKDMPAEVRTVMFLADNITDGDIEAAWEMSKQSRRDPNRLAEQVYKSTFDALTKPRGFQQTPPTEEEVKDAQRQARAMHDAILSETTGKSPGKVPVPEAPAPAAAPADPKMAAQQRASSYTAADLTASAQQAIQQGADRDAVIERLRRDFPAQAEQVIQGL